MNLRDDEKNALTEMVKNFKCPVCGNTHIEFEAEAVFRALFVTEDMTSPKMQKIATGHCGWCGLVLGFDMDKLMSSAKLLEK